MINYQVSKTVGDRFQQ